MSKLIKFEGPAGKAADSASKQTSAFAQKIKDFFGNPVREVPYKIKGDPLLRTDRDPILDIYGPAAPEFRAAAEKHMLGKINPETRVQGSKTMFGGHDTQRLGDILNRYMKSEKKHIDIMDLANAARYEQMGLGMGKKVTDSLGYKATLHEYLKNYLAAGKGAKGDPVANSKVVQDILKNNPTRKDKIKFHPDLFERSEAWGKYTPEERKIIQEAVAKRIINLKKNPTGGGAKGGDMFGYTPIQDTRDRILARRLTSMFNPEYRLHSSTQREIPGSKARNFDKKVDEMEPIAKGVRYARNVGIFALPTAGAAYGTHKYISDGK